MGTTLIQNNDGSWSGGYASTSPFPDANGNINITIDSKYAQQATDLSILTTIIHESFHAYYVYLFNDPSTKQKAINDFGPLFGTDQNAQHDYMVETYKNMIAEYLEDFCVMKGYNVDQSYLNDIAWSGLTQTAAFSRLPEADKIRISNRCLAEIRVNNYEGNPETSKGKSPCIVEF